MLSTYSDPLPLFGAAVTKLNAEDWSAVAQLCDPVSLTAFKRNLVDHLAAQTGQGHKLTATELMKAVPTMPRAVAEYQVTRFRQSLDPTQRMREQLPSVKTRGALESMTPAEVFAAWLDGRSPRRQVERDLELKRMSRVMANEILAQGVAAYNFEVLGCVPDGERVTHIVYRRDLRSRGPFPLLADLAEAHCTPEEILLMRDAWGREHPLTVMARRQDDDNWLLVADTDFLIADQPTTGFGLAPEI